MYELDNNTLLEIKNLSMSFGGLKAVNDLSFDIRRNEIVGLIGPNGAGKTTVFNCVTQFYDDKEGTILFRNKDDVVTNLNDVHVSQVIKEGLVRTFQNVELVKDLSIIDNLLIGAHSLYKTDIISHILHTKKSKNEEKFFRNKAIDILEFMGIGELKEQFAGGQPYGILKKIGIARTLMSEPKLIILDEPAAGLNEQETNELSDLMISIKDKYKCSILLVEHDMGFVMQVCDRICAISFGKFLAMDTPEKIQSDPIVQEAYLGKDED